MNSQRLCVSVVNFFFACREEVAPKWHSAAWLHSKADSSLRSE
jgi:hypothetical protein